LYDAKQWANLFKRSGVKYVVLTSKHHESIAPFSANGGFGRLDPNNTNIGRTIRVAIRLGF
jgi:hypothetical protein